jgi:hypothetical protein
MKINITITEQIKCVQRELALRKNACKRWARTKAMPPEKAAREIARMEAVLKTLKTCERNQQPNLFV